MSDSSHLIPGPRLSRQVRFMIDSAEDAHASATLPTSASIATMPRRAEPRIQQGSRRAPPKYEELYPVSSDPESRRGLKARPSPPKGMDPLAAAMWHNENLSVFHSLPDHLIVQIIKLLTNSGIECLRRAARRFPPLCVREVLRPPRAAFTEVSPLGPFNWPRFVGFRSSPRPSFLDLVDRDEYCSGCRTARRSSRWKQRLAELTEYIHCSKCGADHPACLFSAKQRLMPARIRTCIAHQGFLRVCEHDAGAISLSRLSGLISECQPRRRRRWQREDPRWETAICSDPSHTIPCANSQGGAFPEPSYTCGSRFGLCVAYHQPMIMGIEGRPNWYHLGWTAHVPYDVQISTLRSRLEETYENAGKYVVPCSAKAKESPALRCFDPNDCHCTHFDGSENVRWQWECGPWLPGITECISDPYKCLDTLRPPQPPSSTMAKMIRLFKKKPPKECAADQKRHQSRLEYVPFNRGVGYTAVGVRPCHTGKDCLKVDYIRSFWSHHEGQITPQWYNALDPDSYSITEDEDGLGVFRCRTEGCRNYYRGVLNYAGILRHREFHKKCQRDNCQSLSRYRFQGGVTGVESGEWI